MTNWGNFKNIIYKSMGQMLIGINMMIMKIKTINISLLQNICMPKLQKKLNTK